MIVANELYLFKKMFYFLVPGIPFLLTDNYKDVNINSMNILGERVQTDFIPTYILLII